jgi:Uma2 family endonuclease
MVLQTQQLTLEAFIEFVHEPENAERAFEFINGEIVSVSPGRTTNSSYRDILTVGVHIFCRQNTIPCYTSGEAGAYRIGNDVLAPDFAYKPTPMIDEYPDPEPPLWVMEVISPTDRPDEVRAKRLVYLEAGILYWEMYPKAQSIDVYAPGQPTRTFNIDDMLDGGDVLPGFTLAVKAIFG